jgi:hypothetical protein
MALDYHYSKLKTRGNGLARLEVPLTSPLLWLLQYSSILYSSAELLVVGEKENGDSIMCVVATLLPVVAFSCTSFRPFLMLLLRVLISDAIAECPVSCNLNMLQ